MYLAEKGNNMSKQEWIGEYFLNIEAFHSYKNTYIQSLISLGKCLGEDEAKDKALNVILRDYADTMLRDVYIVNGWGQIIYMR